VSTESREEQVVEKGKRYYSVKIVAGGTILCVLLFIGLVIILIYPTFLQYRDVSIALIGTFMGGAASLTFDEAVLRARERKERDQERQRAEKERAEEREEAEKRHAIVMGVNKQLEEELSLVKKQLESFVERQQVDTAVLGYWTSLFALSNFSPPIFPDLKKHEGMYEARIRSAATRLGIAQQLVDEFVKRFKGYSIRKTDMSEAVSFFDDSSVREFFDAVYVSLPSQDLSMLYKLTALTMILREMILLVRREIDNETTDQFVTEWVASGLEINPRVSGLEKVVEELNTQSEFYQLAKPHLRGQLIVVFKEVDGVFTEMKSVLLKIQNAETFKIAHDLISSLGEMVLQLTLLMETFAI
jgi:hypothetical protein